MCTGEWDCLRRGLKREQDVLSLCRKNSLQFTYNVYQGTSLLLERMFWIAR